MMERGEIFVPDITCMYDHTKFCVDCKLYSTNMDNIRRLARNRYFKNVFGYWMGEFPSVQQVVDLLFVFEDKNPLIHTDTFGITAVPDPLIQLGREAARLRRNYVIKRFEVFKIDDFSFNVRCPNMPG
jgi:hypothetical protein